MKIKVTGDVSEAAIDAVLQKQQAKIEKIDTFCKENKITALSYSDSNLEYEYKAKGGAKNVKENA